MGSQEAYAALPELPALNWEVRAPRRNPTEISKAISEPWGSISRSRSSSIILYVDIIEALICVAYLSPAYVQGVRCQSRYHGQGNTGRHAM